MNGAFATVEFYHAANQKMGFWNRKWAWVSPGTSTFQSFNDPTVLDRCGNGRVDDGAELFSDVTPMANGGKAAHGWAALAQRDTNGDGVIDAKNAVFTDLKVWIDADNDGLTNEGELQSLQVLGIISINIQHDGQIIDQGENMLAFKSSFTTADGGTREA